MFFAPQNTHFRPGINQAGLGFLPGTMRLIHQSWLTIREELATQATAEAEAGEATTHMDLFEKTLKGAAIFFSHIVTSRGAALLGHHHMTLPEEEDGQSLEDADGGGDVDIADGTSTKANARDETARGTLSDAVWELLVLMEPLAYTPQDLAAITTAVANFDRFRTQDRLPPAWQSHSQLLHTALRGGCGQATINFCTPHINEPDAKGFCPMHIAVGCATLAGADAELASKQIGWLLAAGADVDCTDTNGLTPLCNAASASQHRLFVQLVNVGARGGQHTWALIEYKRQLASLESSPLIAEAKEALARVASRNRKLAWYFAWNVLLPSTSSRADCIFQTESFSSCKVAPQAQNQLFRSDGSFNTMNVYGPVPILIKIRPNPSKLSSRTTADLHQPPFRATAAVCRRPLGRRTDPNGRKLTILE